MSPEMRNLTKKYWLIPSHVDWPSLGIHPTILAMTFWQWLLLFVVGLSVVIAPNFSNAQVAEPGDLFPPTGGMWLPSQIPELEGQLRDLGLEIDPNELANPTSNTLALSQASRKLRLFSLAD